MNPTNSQMECVGEVDVHFPVSKLMWLPTTTTTNSVNESASSSYPDLLASSTTCLSLWKCDSNATSLEMLKLERGEASANASELSTSEKCPKCIELEKQTSENSETVVADTNTTTATSDNNTEQCTCVKKPVKEEVKSSNLVLISRLQQPVSKHICAYPPPITSFGWPICNPARIATAAVDRMIKLWDVNIGKV